MKQEWKKIEIMCLPKKELLTEICVVVPDMHRCHHRESNYFSPSWEKKGLSQKDKNTFINQILLPLLQSVVLHYRLRKVSWAYSYLPSIFLISTTIVRHYYSYYSYFPHFVVEASEATNLPVTLTTGHHQSNSTGALTINTSSLSPQQG